LNSVLAAWYAPNDAPVAVMAMPGLWQWCWMNGATSYAM
jgi:hypothetical protein